jgi:hypothetical protein
MNTSKQNQFIHDSDVVTALGETRNEAPNPASSPAEETLRLIARLPAPQGLAERVKAGLCGGQSAPRTVSGRARILPWPTALRMENTWVRSAAAAAIVLVVVGGGWGIYARVAPVQPQKAMVLPHNAAQGGFSSAGAVRKPQTLNRPVAHSATAAPQKAKATAKPAVQPKQTLPHRSKVASADKTATPPATPTEK